MPPKRMTQGDIPLPADDMSRPFRLAFLLLDGFAMLSYAAVTEPFRAANVLARRSLYAWDHLSPDGNAVCASNGAAVAVDAAAGALPPPDMAIVVVGGDPTRAGDPRLFAWLRQIARRGATVAGISGGPYLLARAGLLDGHRATIHWEHQPAFREAFPRVELSPTLYVIDGRRVTCAGGTAGLDLATALIGQAHGPSLAARVADWFINTNLREAHRDQRASLGARYGLSSPPLLRALELMEARVEEPASRSEVARHAGVSLRQLERLFAAQLGTTLGRAYIGLRLEHARHLVRTTDLSLTEIAAAAGFKATAHFSRAFRIRYGQPPMTLRRAHRTIEPA